MRSFSEPAMAEAAQIYGFMTPPDPHTLSTRQVEIIETIAAALDRRDQRIIDLLDQIEQLKERLR